MFGNSINQQPQGVGLFGSSSTALFGAGQSGLAQSQQPQQGQGVWGGTTLGGQMQTSQQSGLFGQTGQPQPQQQSTGMNTGSGLFGQGKPTTGLFSNTSSTMFGQQQVQQPPQPQQTQQGIFGGGIFGQPSSSGQVQGGGLGQQGQSGMNMFGQTNQNQSSWNQPQSSQTGMGLGQQMTTNPQVGGSIFSFGGQQQQQPQGQGIFGNAPQNQIAQQPGQMGGGMGYGQQQSQIKIGNPTQSQTGQGIFSSFPSSGGGIFNTLMNPQQPNQNIFGGQQQMTTGMNIPSGQQGMQSGLGGLNSSLFAPNQQKSGVFGGYGTSTTTGTTQGMGGLQMQQIQQQSNVTTGSFPFAYQVSKIPETTTSGNQSKVENVSLISISGMPNYNSKSLEELRFEDYVNKKKGLQVPKVSSTSGMMTGMTGTSMFPSQVGVSQTSGMFQQQQQGQQQGQQGQQQTSSLFGPKTVQSSGIFGQTPNPTQNMFQTPQTIPQGQTFQIQQPISQTGQQGLFGQNPLMPSSTSGIQGQSLFTQPQTIGIQTNLGQQANLGSTQPQGLNYGLGGQPQKSLFGPTSNTVSTTQPTQGLFSGQKPPEGGLFGQTTTNPQIQSGTSMFSTGQNQQPNSLFAQSTTQPTGGSLFGPKQSSGGLFQSTTPTSGLFGSVTVPQQAKPQEGPYSSSTMPQLSSNLPQASQIPFLPLQSVDYKSFLLNSLEKQKTITDMLNELQREYIVQDFFINDFKIKKDKPRESLFPESKYSYIPISNKEIYDQDYRRFNKKEREHDYDYFLKYKRPHEQRPDSFAVFNQRKEEKDAKGKILGDESRIKKSHSADSFKIKENQIVKKIDKDFNQINLGEEFYRNGRKVDLELTFILLEPKELIFKLIHIDCNTKLKILKQDILNKLKKENKELFWNLGIDDFFLMRNFRTMKESQSLEDNSVKNKDEIHIILKKSLFPEEDESAIQSRKASNLSEKKSSHSNKKEIKIEKSEKIKASSKKKLKSSIAPIEMLPNLTKAGYETTPSMKEICRMTVEELRNVENFSIFNEHGKIEFKGTTDLTKLNLDQIVNIQPKVISLYQNGQIDFKPEKGQGLNKAATLHMFNVFAQKSDENGESEEEKSFFLMSLQKICQNKKVIYKY
jgi:hypothetical protein